ncbi:MAG: nicotinate-nucleotide--dimethylbenzimidazole phosphoribosyltransferase [Coriobacteriia bacterium]|nr:nicotinate-nucleotide--dimethylbenzimidazole phosphoribosyltransferase [Coriobacteriia bacterium]
MADDMTGYSGPYERDLYALVDSVNEPDRAIADRMWDHLDALTKPPKSLGKLEEIVVKMAVAQQSETPEAAPCAIVLFAGDHGVVDERVSAWPSEVTRQMVANFVAGGAAINQLAAHVGARLVLADVGVASDTSDLPGVLQAKERQGTRNLAKEPAMTREECSAAFLSGARIVSDLAQEGVRVVGVGEMGIGNTTSASALVAAYTGVPVSRIVGRGTGIDDATLSRKGRVIESAMALHAPASADAVGTLASLGGLEIAAMAGAFVGGAAAGICVVSDGFISSAAGLAAARLCPACLPHMFGSHLSAEPGHRVALVDLAIEPMVDLDMRLGEGTGAAIAMGIMGAACAVANGMATFAEAGVTEREDV